MQPSTLTLFFICSSIVFFSSRSLPEGWTTVGAFLSWKEIKRKISDQVNILKWFKANNERSHTMLLSWKVTGSRGYLGGFSSECVGVFVNSSSSAEKNSLDLSSEPQHSSSSCCASKSGFIISSCLGTLFGLFSSEPDRDWSNCTRSHRRSYCNT